MKWFVKRRKVMNIISFDPSGNHNSEKEGMGTTGYCICLDSKIQGVYEIRASDYEDTVAYWVAHTKMLSDMYLKHGIDHIVIEGYKLYNHAGMSAQTQANSTLMTPQLIGVLKTWAYTRDIPYTIQFASDVKTRWSNKVLQAKGYLGEGDTFKGKRTNNHKRDSLRHMCHFLKYKAKIPIILSED